MSYPPADQPPYGQPPQPPQPPYGGMPPYGGVPSYGGAGFGQPPQNYLVWAILTTVLCCLPLGVVSIVYASQVNSKWAMGDAQGAYDSSRKAKTFAIWGAAAGVAVLVIYGILVALRLASTDLSTY